MGRARAALTFLSVLAFGLVVMLLTIAVGAGDTSVGNSNEPWIAGYAIVLGVPVTIGVVAYWLLRRTGVARRRALAFSAGVAVAIPVLLIGSIDAIVAAGS